MAGLPPETVERLAQRLLDAEAHRQPLDPLTDEHPGLTLADAYRIQHTVITAKLARGARVVGRKAGFTSRAMQQQMGVGEANHGALLDYMLLAEAVPTAELIQPRVEPEIAFLLGQDLAGPGVTPLDALRATRWIAPALEIVDSRFHGYRFRAADNTADNSSAARVVLGAWQDTTQVPDLELERVALERNGAVVEQGVGGAALGHPALALAWIANKLAESGAQLSAGDLVISGGLTAAPAVQAGDHVTARFDALGAVTALFV
jgi:2-keto-4-pentenoate hydratase